MPTILVADDDQLLRAIIRERLERAGHEVLEAGDGIAALELAMDERPDGLLLDVMMPLARGLEVVREVRRQDGWNPAIVMISARTRFTDRANALEAGADEYVEKPFEPEDLLDLLERRLAHVEPSRIVDVVGPIWTALAEQRLRAHDETPAAPPGTAPDLAELFFRDQVAATLGRQIDTARQSVDRDLTLVAIHHLWENALESVAGQAIEREIPVRRNIDAPDATAALFDHVAASARERQRALQPTSIAVGTYWDLVIDEILDAGAARKPAAPNLDRVAAATSTALRSSLDAHDHSTALTTAWSDRLRHVHTAIAEETTRPTVIDALEVVWMANEFEAPIPHVGVAS